MKNNFQITPQYAESIFCPLSCSYTDWLQECTFSSLLHTAFERAARHIRIQNIRKTAEVQVVRKKIVLKSDIQCNEHTRRIICFKSFAQSMNFSLHFFFRSFVVEFSIKEFSADFFREPDQTESQIFFMLSALWSLFFCSLIFRSDIQTQRTLNNFLKLQFSLFLVRVRNVMFCVG